MLNWILTAVLAVSLPATPPPSPAPVPANPPLAQEPAQVLELPPELKERVQKEILKGDPSKRERLDRLLHMVLDPGGLDLKYLPDATASVAQTYATRTTNCMSFTMLFIALAREAGLEVYAQEIPETVAWHQDSGVIYRVDHINAVVRIGNVDYPVDIMDNSLITLRQPRLVNDQRLLAHFYNNLAMRDLEDDKIAPALQEMNTALQLDPGFATDWSNAGVLFLRSGDAAAAEKAYAKALEIDPENTGGLANMANLAQIQGDHDREAQYRKRLEALEQRDPIFHFIEAVSLEESGDYERAIDQYQHAIHLHGSEPRFFAAMAHAYVLEGDMEQAISALRRAAWLSTGSQHDDYRKQIDALRSGAMTVQANVKGT